MSSHDIARAEQIEWLDQAPGKRMDPDRAYGLQCVDGADQYAQDLLGRPWRETIGAVPGAKSLMDTANPAYFEKIWNDPNNVTLIPQVGDIIVWAGSPLNVWGHVAVVMEASTRGVKVVQQDGFAAPTKYVVHPDGVTGGWYSDKPMHVADLGYDNPGTGPVRGWLRPRADKIPDTGARTRIDPARWRAPEGKPVDTITPQGVMHGIDIASWQKGIDLSVIPADFAIVKVTGGTDYVNPLAVQHVKEARASGKLIGLYHYAAEFGRRGTPVQEAAHFLRHALPLMDKNTNLVLDWENPAVTGPGGNVWAKEWLDIVARDTNTTPWFYGYVSAINAHPWETVSKTYPLWLAWYGSDAPMHGYATDFTIPPQMKINAPFKLLAWQYSQHGRLRGFDGKIDLNVFFGTGDTWRAYAQGKTPTPVSPQNVKKDPGSASNSGSTSNPTLHVVKPGDTLRGICDRYKVSLPAVRVLNRYITNPNYLAVGDRVKLPEPGAKVIHVVSPGESLQWIANRYSTTTTALQAANSYIKDPNYLAVGDRVAMPTAPGPRVHVVRPGESLQMLADAYRTTIPAIRALNAYIRDPNYLAVGDRVALPI